MINYLLTNMLSNGIFQSDIHMFEEFKEIDIT